jgi:hypothetical protein
LASEESHVVDYLLMVDVEPTYANLRKLEMSMIRILHYISRFCGDENINKAIKKIETTIMLVRSCQIAIRALEAAEGPIGWLYALTTVAGAGIMGMTAVQELGS